MSALISIIVPIYNVEDYLQECLESIAAQTYQYYECLLVNDGSTDKSRDICEQFCKKDIRFHLLDQKKKGVSAARNMGLNAAKGDYILFVDGDDFLFPEALQTAWKELVSSSCDWIMFDYLRTNTTNASLSNYSGVLNKQNDINYLDRDTALSGLLDSRDTAYCVVWNKLYTRQCLEDIRFKSVSYAEDLIFNYEVFRRTRHFVRIRQCLYLWRIRKGSQTTIGLPDRYLSHFKAMLLLDNLSLGDDSLARGLCLKKIYRQQLITRFHIMGTEQYPEFLSLAKEIRGKTIREYLSNKSISLFEKTRILLLWSCPHVMKAILKAFGN